MKEAKQAQIEEEARLQQVAEEVFDAWMKENTPQPITDPAEQKKLLECWIRLSNNAGLWGGYPLGHSYIDDRCGAGYGMIEVKDFVDFDHEVALKIPLLRGKQKREIAAYLETL
jgi:hypothetical protein